MMNREASSALAWIVPLSAWIAVMLFLLTAPARSDPTGYENSPFFKWYGSVHEPDNPLASCCGEGDAYRMMEYHTSSKQGYSFEGWTQPKVKRDGTTIQPMYVLIPDYKVNWDDVNPVGVGVVWLGGGDVDQKGEWDPIVLCFVPATGS
jgi:hypothetical protein